MLRRLLFLAAVIALVANRRRVRDWLVKVSGTNVTTVRNSSRSA